jgi:2-hydroxychromene-2-carboxylate isomerase
MPPRLAFWYEFASTYSYLAAARIGRLAAQHGVAVELRPFLLGPLFREQGWDTSPFNIYPAKGRYMWRDVERQAAARGVPFRRPAVFPRNGLLAARLSTAAAHEPWGLSFAEAVFRANFAEDREIADPATLAAILAALGVARPGEWLERAATPAVKESLRARTEEARGRGIFGAPSFVVADELFWGDDRLEAALAWAVAASTSA